MKKRMWALLVLSLSVPPFAAMAEEVKTTSPSTGAIVNEIVRYEAVRPQVTQLEVEYRPNMQEVLTRYEPPPKKAEPDNRVWQRLLGSL